MLQYASLFHARVHACKRSMKAATECDSWLELRADEVGVVPTMFMVGVVPTIHRHMHLLFIRHFRTSSLLYPLQASALLRSGNRILSNAVRVTVFAPLALVPPSLTLAPGSLFTVSESSGNTLWCLIRR